MSLIAKPLGLLMKACYFICKNYGLALLLFTFITRILVFPLNVKQQKSTAKMTMLKPKLDELQKKYGKNQQKLQEEQMKLYSESGANPMASCLPMIVMLVILWAMIPVIYGPLTYVSNLDKDKVTQSNELISNLNTVSTEVKGNGTTLQALVKDYEKDGKDPYYELSVLFKDEEKYPKSAKALDKDQELTDVIAVIKEYPDIDTFVTDETFFSQGLIQSRPELMTFVFAQDKTMGDYSGVLSIVDPEIKKYAEEFKYESFGIYMGTIPTWKNITVIIPILSFLMQLILTFVGQRHQKKTNPAAASMGGMNVMMYLMPLFSLWIAFSYPIGLGLYWIYSSFFSLIQTIVLNKIYTPEHVAELIEKDMAKAKSSGKKTFMEKVAEAQLMQAGKDPAQIRKEAAGDDYVEEKKKSKNDKKNENRNKLNEARKRMAEKYGDEYDDQQD